VAEAHGGRIRAQNQSGGGARIEMRIPAGTA
jgi:signal transduction histidine kinase